jgi:hypothetical protein
MAFTGIAALVAGEVAVDAVVVLAAISEVGMVMTVVGAVTGDKTLMKIGGIMGLVGGIGGMVAGAAGGAGAMEAAAASDAGGGAAYSVAGDVAGEAGLAADAAGAASDAGNGLISSELASPVSGLNPASELSTAPGATTSMPMDTAAQATAAPTQAATNTAPLSTDVATQSGNLGALAPTGATGPVSPADYQVGGRFGPDNMDVGGGYNPATAGGAPMSSSNFLGKISDFAKNNSKLFEGGMQLVGGAMKGANDRQMWDQKIALEQQRVNQVGFGNSVGQFAGGIVNGARA